MENRIITARQLAAFRARLREEERSEATVEKYLREARRFAAWLGGGAVTKAAAAGWKEALLSRGCEPATVNGKLTALDRFLDFLGWGDCKVRHLKLQRRLFRDDSRELTREEYQRLVAAAERAGRERLSLLMEAICGTGIRVSEVKYLTVEAAQAGCAEISLKGKIRTILIPGKLCRKLLKYAKKQKTASGEIFLTRNGKSLTRHQIWAEMKAMCLKANVQPSKVFPHNLRHLFARTFYQVYRDVVKLAGILGHSSIETTRIYLLTTGVEYRKQMSRLGLIS